MDWTTVMDSFSDELQKIASEAKKAPIHEKVVDVGAPILVGSGVGKTLSDLSLSAAQGASPRRKTIGTLMGALAGLGWHKMDKAKKKRKRQAASQTKTAADPFQFKGTATPRFLSKPGKTVSSQAPKIGRLGTLPKMP